MSASTSTSVETARFGSHLVETRRLTRSQLRLALGVQQRQPFLHLGEVIRGMGLLDDTELERALAEFKGLEPGTVGPVLEARVPAATPPSDGPRPTDVFDKIHACKQARFFREAQVAGTYPYFTPIEGPESPRTRVGGREIVLLAANSYLGLSEDASVIEAAIEATRQYGVGTSGSPMLNGTMDLHLDLEIRLAAFAGAPAAALFSTGFQTNLGVIAAVVGRGDVVIADALAHASIHDGCQLSMGEFKRFHHNDMDHLERLLVQAGPRGKLVVVDGVYSMDGDLVDLPNVVALARRHGARVLLDDAHGFGVLGAHGRGTAEHFGLEGQIDLTTATFSKALGTIGGCVLGDVAVVRYLKHRSRPFIFSASLPPGTVAATRRALERLADDGLRERLQANVGSMRKGLEALGYTLGTSCSHILPVMIGQDQLALEMGTALLADGVLVGTVVSPGVPPGQARLRVSLMASHQQADLSRALDAFERVGRRLGVIPRLEGARS